MVSKVLGMELIVHGYSAQGEESLEEKVQSS